LAWWRAVQDRSRTKKAARPAFREFSFDAILESASPLILKLIPQW